MKQRGTKTSSKEIKTFSQKNSSHQSTNNKSYKHLDLPKFAIWSPSFEAAFYVIFIARFLGAVLSHITDCDEVFNYWEPTHYLQYGYGLQTWEYSPVYAIRSWAYIFPHLVIAKLGELLFSSKVQIFYFVRISLGIISALSEASLCRSVVQNLNPLVGNILLVFLTFSAGMFHGAVAYLPSTFALMAITFAYASALKKEQGFRSVFEAIFCFAIGSLGGWPFSAVMAFPYLLFRISNSQYKCLIFRRIIFSGIASLVVVLTPIVVIDRHFYRFLSVVPWNIISYNVFGGKERGPELYGTEPWIFYFINGVLNFNFVFLLAVLSFPLAAVSRLVSQKTLFPALSFYQLSLLLSPFYLWLGIFSRISHKEERFLFVTYSMLCLNAAISSVCAMSILDFLVSCFFSLKTAKRTSRFFLLLILFSSSLISLSRITGLILFYEAPTKVYSDLITKQLSLFPTEPHDPRNITYNICVGAEWYRFPSHYWLPEHTRLRFLRSEFKGILPKYFMEDESISLFERSGTWLTPTGMNDLNKEEEDRYISKDDCHIVIDYFWSKASLPKNTTSWRVISCHKMLDTPNSPKFARSFYLPAFVIRVFEKFSKQSLTLKWGNYCLIKHTPSCSQ